MKLFRYTILFILVTLGIGFGSARYAQAATLSAYPDHRTVSLGETFTVDIRLNSEQQVVNAVTATIIYPKDLLEVVDVSRGGSFLTLWPVEPTIDTNTGTITLTGGIPNGSFVVDGKILTITFSTKDTGGVEVKFDTETSQVLLNDGAGTPATLTLNSGIYKIDDLGYISILSPSHPDENKWYRSRKAVFEWTAENDAEYSYVLGINPDDVPDDTAERTNGQVTFNNVADGIQYFIVKEKRPNRAWQIVGRRRLQIDATPPEPITASVNQDNSVLVGQYYLAYNTTDNASGIDYYDVTENSTVYRNVSSPFILKEQDPNGWLVVTAHDRAGNMTRWTEGTSPTPERSQNSYYLAIIATAIIAIFTAILIKLRLRHR
ncbi:MAG: cohesin domain-containing protein [Patescibacteria group bacterium]